MDWIREMESGLRQQRRGRVREILIVLSALVLVTACVLYFALGS